MDKPQVAVVTGNSNGIGKEIALMLARNGFTTYATMRNLAKSSGTKNYCRKRGPAIEDCTTGCYRR